MILVFAYNRPSHIEQTLNALLQNHGIEQLPVTIIIDGPKRPEDEPLIKQVAACTQRYQAQFKQCQIIQREYNFGLAKNIITGVTDVLKRHESVIVLEDDIITSPGFIEYMQQGLAVYHNEPQVASIHGYCFPVKASLPETFFLKGADCWGWATWRSAWETFEQDGQKLLDQIDQRGCQTEFNFNGTYDYYKMLQDQVAGKNDSWAVRWYASCFLNNMVTLYPGKSLVQNIGLDNSGTHCGVIDNYLHTQLASHVSIAKQSIVPHQKAWQVFHDYFYMLQPIRMSIIHRLKRWDDQVYNKAGLPPLLQSIMRIMRKLWGKQIRWQGDYPSWSAAVRASQGYAAETILERVASATTALIRGEVKAERDGVTFDVPLYHFSLLTVLYHQAIRQNALGVIDFGGGLGSVYWNNYKFLIDIKALHWCVVEQPAFVRYGQENVTDNVLSFHLDVDNALAALPCQPSVVFLGGVLQYLQSPEKMLESLLVHQVPIVFIDRTVFNDHNSQRLTVQKTSGVIGNTSYPCWLLDYQSLCDLAKKYGYELIFQYNDVADDVQLNVRVRSLCFQLGNQS